MPRRPVLLLALLVALAGGIAQGRAADAIPDMAGLHFAAAAPGGDCGDCGDGLMSAAACQVACGFCAIMAASVAACPGEAVEREALTPERRLPGWRGPPDPHPPKLLLPV